MNEVLKIPLEFTLESCLLHLYISKKDAILTNNLLIAAKLLKEQNWKSRKIPYIGDWNTKCQYLLLMN